MALDFLAARFGVQESGKTFEPFTAVVQGHQRASSHILDRKLTNYLAWYAVRC
jgi:hypothetical protein